MTNYVSYQIKVSLDTSQPYPVSISENPSIPEGAIAVITWIPDPDSPTAFTFFTFNWCAGGTFLSTPIVTDDLIVTIVSNLGPSTSGHWRYNMQLLDNRSPIPSRSCGDPPTRPYADTSAAMLASTDPMIINDGSEA